MTVTVPIDLDVVGGGLSDAIEDDLRDARGAARRAGDAAGDAFGDGFERQVSASAKEVDALLAEATRTRNAEIDVDVNGMANLAALRESLDLTKQRAEVAALEKALDDVAKLRRAGVDVEVDGTRELATLDRALKAVERRHVVEVETDVDTDSFERIAKSAARNAGGVSDAFSGAFRLIAANAIVLSAVVVAAFAALPVAGAAAAAGLVLGFGAGIAGIGILAAAQSEEVKKAFGSMADDIVKDMRRIAAPLEGTLIGIAGDVRGAFASIAPELKRSFAQIAPVLTQFSGQFFDAFARLEPAIQPLTDAFDDLLSSIGPRLDGFFTNIGDALIHLSDVISSDPDLFAGLFVGLMNVIPLAIDLIADLAQAFKIIVDVFKSEVAPAWQEFTDSIQPLTDALSGSTSGADIFRFAIEAIASSIVITLGVLTNMATAIGAIVSGVRAAGKFIADTWKNTATVTSSSFARIRAVVSSAVGAVRATVSRGLSAVRSAFSTGFADARAVVTGAMNSIRAVVSGAISRVTGVVRSGLSAVRGAFSSGFAAARSVVTGAMSSIRGAVSSGIGRVISLVASLPGRIRGALGSLGSILFSSGVSLINGFASGIRSAIGNAVSAASSAVSAVRGFFPFSPAKEGPFSGTGYTTYSGEALMKDFAKSMAKTADAVAPQVANALDPFARAIPSVLPRSAQPSVTNTTTNNGVTSEALASMLGGIQVIVRPGMDRRAMAELWLNGKKHAEALA